MNDVNRLSYFFGNSCIEQNNVDCYTQLVRSLMDNVERRLSNEKDNYVKVNTLKKTGDWKEEVLLKGKRSLFASGCIVNAPSYFADTDPQTVMNFISAVNPTMIIIIDHDGLSTVLKDLPNVITIRMPKNGGAIHINDNFRKRMTDLKFQTCFFDDKFICTREVVPFSKLEVYQIIKNPSSHNQFATTSASKSDLMIIKKDLNPEDFSKAVLGVTTLAVKSLNNMLETNKAEALVKSPLISVIYIFSVKDAQNSESGQTLKDVEIIRPANMQNNYLDHVIVCGDIMYIKK